MVILDDVLYWRLTAGRLNVYENMYNPFVSELFGSFVPTVGYHNTSSNHYTVFSIVPSWFHVQSTYFEDLTKLRDLNVFILYSLIVLSVTVVRHTIPSFFFRRKAGNRRLSPMNGPGA